MVARFGAVEIKAIIYTRLLIRKILRNIFINT